jgi:threonine/homoserine/homoserine lactone efflux protein
LRAPTTTTDSALQPAPALHRIFRDGAVVALFNPKTAIFFAAFLPQFIDPGASAVAQSAMFGSTFVAIAACTDTAYVLAAGIAAPSLSNLRRAGSLGRYLTAAVYIGLGVFTAASGSRSSK